MTALRILPSQWSPVYSLSLIVLLVITGFSIVVPALPLYARSLGASDLMIGMLFSAFAIARVAANFPAGLLASRFSWKPLILFGLGLIVVSSVVAAFAANFWMLFAMRILEGAGSGIYMTVSTTAVAALSPTQTRGRSIGVYSSMLLVGAAIGPVVGGALVPLWGASSTFLFYALVVLAGFVICQLTIKGSTAAANPAGIGPYDSLRLATANRSVFMVYSGTFVSALAWAGIGLTVVPLLAYDNLKLLPVELGLVLAGSGFTNIILAVLSGHLTDRFGRKRPVILSLLASGVIVSLIARSTSFQTLAFTMALWGVADGFWGQLVAWTADLSPSRQMGISISLSRTANDLGFVIGPLLLAFIVEVTRSEIVASTPFTVTTILLFAIGVSLLLVKDPSRGSSPLRR